jgi:hypothetical protein
MLEQNYYETMAAYNAWMNQKLYAICADISDEKRKENLGAFFQSIHGTLNHLLFGDRVWMGRFTQQPFPYNSTPTLMNYATNGSLLINKSSIGRRRFPQPGSPNLSPTPAASIAKLAPYQPGC